MSPVVVLALTPVMLALNAGAASRPASVLIFPLEARGNVTPDLAEQLTGALAIAASRHADFTVQAVSEVSAALTLEQQRQAAGCSTESCALEIAGALAADQIVVGNVGRVGDSYVVTLSRVRSRDAHALKRIQREFPHGTPEELLRAMPGIAEELLGSSPVTTPPPSAAPRSDESAGEPGWKTGARGTLRGLGVLGVAPPILGLVTSAALGTAAVGLLAYDLVNTRNGVHAVTQTQAFVANVVVASVVLGLGLAVVLIVPPVVLMVLSWVLP
ncbi:MAG: hypothetical protein AB2A00_20700 [Myxococcota bacterium]